MYGHSGVINASAFSSKGDFFATGGVDGTLLLWKSGFTQEKGESILQKGLCETGHRVDARTQPTVQECMKKRSRVTPTVTDGFF